MRRDTTEKHKPDQPLENRSREEIYNLARAKKIRGRSKMDKSALIRAIKRA